MFRVSDTLTEKVNPYLSICAVSVCGTAGKKPKCYDSDDLKFYTWLSGGLRGLRRELLISRTLLSTVCFDNVVSLV